MSRGRRINAQTAAATVTQERPAIIPIDDQVIRRSRRVELADTLKDVLPERRPRLPAVKAPPEPVKVTVPSDATVQIDPEANDIKSLYGSIERLLGTCSMPEEAAGKSKQLWVIPSLPTDRSPSLDKLVKAAGNSSKQRRAKKSKAEQEKAPPPAQPVCEGLFDAEM